MVAGVDPYPQRGTADIAKAFVRASGNGGCVSWKTQEKQEYVR